MLYSKIFKKIVILAVFTAQIGQVFGATEIDAADIVAGGFFAKASRVFTNAVHEFGHALTGRFLFGKEVGIHVNLGSRGAESWYSNKFITLRKDMLFPKNGQYAQTEFNNKIAQQNLKSTAIMKAAGPAAGLAFAGCIAYAGYRAESYDNKNIAPILYGTAAAQSFFQLEQILPGVEKINFEKIVGKKIPEKTLEKAFSCINNSDIKLSCEYSKNDFEQALLQVKKFNFEQEHCLHIKKFNTAFDKAIDYNQVSKHEIDMALQSIKVSKEGIKTDGARILEALDLSENAKRTFTRSVRHAMVASLGLAGAKIWSIYSNVNS